MPPYAPTAAAHGMTEAAAAIAVFIRAILVNLLRAAVACAGNYTEPADSLYLAK